MLINLATIQTKFGVDAFSICSITHLVQSKVLAKFALDLHLPTCPFSLSLYSLASEHCASS